MNTQIHAYRDIPAIRETLRGALTDKATIERLRKVPTNTHGAANPAGGAMHPLPNGTVRRNNTPADELLRLDLKGAL